MDCDYSELLSFLASALQRKWLDRDLKKGGLLSQDKEMFNRVLALGEETEDRLTQLRKKYPKAVEPDKRLLPGWRPGIVVPKKKTGLASSILDAVKDVTL